MRALLSRPLEEATFTHVDPTGALARVLITGPLADDPAGQMSNVKCQMFIRRRR